MVQRKKIIRFFPLLFILITWFIFSSPYFLKGQVPYPSKYQVTFFAPWSHYQEWAGPVKNNAMPDIITQIYPWKHITLQSFKAGQIPYWNPYSFAGNPHMANFQTAVFSPFNLLFFVLPFIDAWSIVVLLQPLLAGSFLYLLMRQLGTSKVGSILSSVAFMFCGFIVVWMAYGTLAMAILFLPLALFAIEKYRSTKNSNWFWLLTCSILLSLFSGHFQTSVYFLLYTLAYGFYTAIKERKRIYTFSLLLFFIGGCVLSLIQILPSMQFYEYAVRSQSFIQGGGIPWHYLITIVAPDFYGNPVTRNDWFGTYAEWSSFIGIVPFCLALFSIIDRKKQQRLFFLLAGLTALLFAADTPLTQLLGWSRIPVLSTSNPPRAIVLFSFSFAVLAGMGFDSLISRLTKKTLRYFFVILLSVFSVLALIWISLLLFHALPADKANTALRNLVVPTAFFGLLTFGIVAAVFIPKKYSKHFLIVLLIGMTVFESLRFATKWMPFDPRELVFPDVPVISAIKEHIGLGRIFGNVGNEVTGYYGFASIEGYDPLYIERYGEFLRAAYDGTYQPAERVVATLSNDGKYTDRVLDLLGVTLFFHPLPDTNQSWAYPVWSKGEKYQVVYQDDKFALYKNTTALPRATIFYDFEVIPGKKESLARFYSDSFDYRNRILLEDKPLTIKSIESRAGTDSAKITSYLPNEITIETETSRPGLLFLADNYYPGWQVTVNGNESKIYRANYTFRAIEVPKGKSIVKLYYKGVI